MPKWCCLQIFRTIYTGEQVQMTSVIASYYRLILDVNQAFDGVSPNLCTLFRCYILCMIRFLLYQKQDYYGHNLRHLKWVKTTKEYVASLIALYKNNGAFLCGRIKAFSKEVVRLGTAIGGVWLWADIGRNCKTFFLILRNATSMSVTNQHSSKWYPRLITDLQKKKKCKYLGSILSSSMFLQKIEAVDIIHLHQQSIWASLDREHSISNGTPEIYMKIICSISYCLLILPQPYMIYMPYEQKEVLNK